jgi:hypothetical protein
VPEAPPNRSQLQRQLILNAATKPVNVAVPAGVAVAGVLVAPWLFGVALVVYFALAATTFFDENEAQRVGDKAYGRVRPLGAGGDLDPKTLVAPIRAQLEAARAEQVAIAKTIEGSDLAWADVSGEVSSLVSAIEAAARRAQKLNGYLAAQDVGDIDRRIRAYQQDGQTDTAQALRTQRTELERLDGMLRKAYGEMEQVNAALKTVHARLVGAAVSSEADADATLAGDVRELRHRVETLTDGLGTAPA